MRSTKRSIALILAVILLALSFAFTLASCQKDGADQTPADTPAPADQDGAAGENGNGTPASAELTVSFDEDATYDVDSLSDALDVKVVENGVARSVSFTIKSSEITTDGQYIKVVITAEGLEKTVMLPHSVYELPIREDLKPLYDLFTKEGDKAISLRVSGGFTADGNSEEQTFAVRLISNTVDDTIQFALTDADEENEKAIILYNDGTLTVAGKAVSQQDLEQYLAAFFGGFGDYDADMPADENDADLEDEVLLGDEEDGALPWETLGSQNDLIAAFFVALSSALDACDTALANPILAQMNLGFSRQNGTYTLHTNSKKLIQIIGFFSDDEKSAELGKYIDMLDAQLDGALKNGDVKIGVTLTVAQGGISADVQICDEVTGAAAALRVALQCAQEPFALPEECVEPDLSDLELTTTISLPANNAQLALTAILHLSSIFSEENSDYLTVNLTYNEDDAACFVLNDRYIYLDMSGLAAKILDTEIEASDYIFYEEFEIDGEPATLMEILPTLLLDTHDEEPIEEPDEDEDPGEEKPDEDPRFANGFGCTVKDGCELIFPIGVTEEEVRACLNVYTVGEEEDPEAEPILIPFEEYTLEGYDFTTGGSFHDMIKVVFAPDREWHLDLVVFDPAKTLEYGVEVEKIVIPLGADLETVMQEYAGATIYFTDLQVFWTTYTTDIVIVAVQQEEDLVPVDGTYVFDHTGAYTVQAKRAGVDENLNATVYVYDPENLQPVEFRCAEEIWVDENTTEEEVRDLLNAEVLYDDDCWYAVTDFEISGAYAYGVENFDVTWQDFACSVHVNTYAYADDDDFDILDFLKYLRPTVIDAESDEEIIAKLQAVIEENKELFEAVFTVEDNTLRIVINEEDDKDLLAIINLFVGIPTEDGWQDIDADALLSLVETLQEEYLFDIPVAPIFKNFVGVELADALAKLCFGASVAREDGIAVNFEWNDGDETTYGVTNISIRLVDAAEPFVVPNTEGVQDFSAFATVSAVLLMSFVAPFFA